MCRGILASMLAGLLVLGLALPAQACLNDRETKTRETEFKLQYDQPAVPATSSASDEETPIYRNAVLLVAGGVLLTAGLGVGLGVGIVASRKS